MTAYQRESVGILSSSGGRCVPLRGDLDIRSIPLQLRCVEYERLDVHHGSALKS